MVGALRTFSIVLWVFVQCYSSLCFQIVCGQIQFGIIFYINMCEIFHNQTPLQVASFAYLCDVIHPLVHFEESHADTHWREIIFL